VKQPVAGAATVVVGDAPAEMDISRPDRSGLGYSTTYRGRSRLGMIGG
jgi:hypothetical protein